MTGLALYIVMYEEYVSGLMVTAKKRQEFRIKLQKRARRKAEKRLETLEEEKRQKEVGCL